MEKIRMKRHGWALLLATAALIAAAAGRAPAQTPAPGHLVIGATAPGVKISPTLYGLMTEEINHAYDGGLYAELIRNRSFKDDPSTPVHWSVAAGNNSSGSIALDTERPVNATALTTSLRLDIERVSPGERVGVSNDGYWGIPVTPDTTYRASFYARAGDGFKGPLLADIESEDGRQVFASARVGNLTDQWRHYTVRLTTESVTPSAANRFVISAARPGKVWLSLVSLFPPTWKNRPNGNRIDLMQQLAGMRPAFLRFPGGNYLEGNTIAERFNWKQTIGDLSQRPGHQGPWGYRSTDGMGLLEFLEWCGDLKMQPLLAVYAGYSLRGEHVTPGPDLQPFVQDALDEIEYVSGAAGTRWGSERARNGHRRPFKLEYVEIGNEDGFDRSGSYDGRFAQFYDAIKAHYPALKVIATATVKSRTPDVIDDHFYRSAGAMEGDVHHYDATSRTGPRIFVGEWATTEGAPTPTFDAAMGDAAWLTGLERNSDIVTLSCYAPLLVNVNRGASQWGTNLIGYKALSSFGSPSYYVQKMFRDFRGDAELPVQVVPQSGVPTAPRPRGAVGVGTWHTRAEYRDIKVTRGAGTLYQDNLSSGLAGWTPGRGDWSAQDGALRQSSLLEDCRMTVGSPDWTSYTYSLRARKLGGDEGFLILFHVRDRRNVIWWNLGGWGNTRHALERLSDGGKQMLGAPTPGSIETGRWYSIRIEVRGRRIRCYLDDRLVTEAIDRGGSAAPVFAAASRSDRDHSLLLKVVNVSTEPQRLSLELQGIRSGRYIAAGEVITGNPEDQNSIETPDKVTPQPITFPIEGRATTHEFPAHSVTALRIRRR